MRSSRSRLVLLGLVVVLAAGSLAACTDDNASVFISGNVAGDDACSYTPSNAQWLGGALDTGLSVAYFAHPLYNSQLITRASDGPLAADPNGVHVEGAVVELRDAAGAAIGDAFTVTTSTYVPPGTSSDPGQAVGSLELVPPAYGLLLADRAAAETYVDIVASVTPFGHTTGGTEIESREWLWTILVCNGCLQECATGDELDMAEGACFVGQDHTVKVDCTMP